MLKDIAKEYTISQENYNCAEVMLHACNDYYHLNLGKKALNMIIPFGGGMYAGRACGILTGGVAALGAIFAEDKRDENIRLKEKTREWVEKFQEEFEDSECNIIRQEKRDPEKGCKPLMVRGAEILEGIIGD